jgi:hypothetical protein
MTDEGDAAAAVPGGKTLIRPALPGTFSRKGREKGAPLGHGLICPGTERTIWRRLR